MVIVIVGWVFFASPDFKSAFMYIGSMINVFDLGITDNVFLYRFFSYLPILVVSVIGAMPGARNNFLKITEKKLLWVRGLLCIIALFVCLAYLVDDTYNPFLYFQFFVKTFFINRHNTHTFTHNTTCHIGIAYYAFYIQA